MKNPEREGPGEEKESTKGRSRIWPERQMETPGRVKDRGVASCMERGMDQELCCFCS